MWWHNDDPKDVQVHLPAAVNTVGSTAKVGEVADRLTFGGGDSPGPSGAQGTTGCANKEQQRQRQIQKRQRRKNANLPARRMEEGPEPGTRACRSWNRQAWVPHWGLQKEAAPRDVFQTRLRKGKLVLKCHSSEETTHLPWSQVGTLLSLLTCPCRHVAAGLAELRQRGTRRRDNAVCLPPTKPCPPAPSGMPAPSRAPASRVCPPGACGAKGQSGKQGALGGDAALVVSSARRGLAGQPGWGLRRHPKPQGETVRGCLAV